MCRLCVFLLVALAGAGCSGKKAGTPGTPETPGSPGTPNDGSPVDIPCSGAQAQATRASAMEGEVLERLDAAPYSYLRLGTAEGEKWVAVPQGAIAKGSKVALASAMGVRDFEVKGLGRRFELVYFGALK